VASEEWTTAEHANRYLALADSVPRRAEGEGVLSDQVPREARRILDLGTGDGRLLALLQADRPDTLGVGLDFSDLMLDAARERFGEDERFEQLEPGGVFANFEHVASATHRLHLKFFAAIDEPLEHEDPSDRLLDVETQLGWLREHGYDDVDCYWKWLEMALLVGVKPG
jgi:tRNA (cmo5U34)-methyltransferase